MLLRNKATRNKSHYMKHQFINCISFFAENVNEDAESSVSGEGSSSMEASSVTDITTKPHYEAESPDELALVQAASSYGCKLLKRTPDRVKLWLPGTRALIELKKMN